MQESSISASSPAIELTPSLRAFATHADNALARALPALKQPPAELHRAMHYAVMGAGKRMRPLLVYAAGAAFGAPLERLDAAAVAVEIIHAYSLVHDDLPAMDDDSLRRGRPTCHVDGGHHPSFFIQALSRGPGSLGARARVSNRLRHSGLPSSISANSTLAIII